MGLKNKILKFLFNEDYIKYEKKDLKFDNMNPLQKKVFRYIHHRNKIGKGLGEIYTLKNLIYINAAISIPAKLIYDPIPLVYWIIWVVTSIVILVGCWVLGTWWDKIKGYDIEAEWSNLRNPAMKELRKNKSEKKNG